jgi:hypothetical protein
MKRFRLLAMLPFAALIAASCGKNAEQSGGQTSQAPMAEAPAAASMPHIENRSVKYWMTGLTSRRPGLDARRGVSLGEGALGVNATPDAAAWFETVDLDSNGTREKVGFMWDATNKVMYAYTHDPVMLEDGTMADKGLLVTQYGEGNTRQRDAGSGFWAYATSRDTSTSGNVSGTLFGCRFDKLGNETECGAGEWSRMDNDFKISSKVK